MLGDETADRRGAVEALRVRIDAELLQRLEIGPALDNLIGFLCGSFATECPPDGVEYAVDETHRLVGAERPPELQCLVDDHLGRRLRLVEKLVDAEAEDQPVHDVHPLDAPVFGGLDDQRIELRGVRRNARRQQRRKGADALGRRCYPAGPPVQKVRHTSSIGMRPTSH